MCVCVCVCASLFYMLFFQVRFFAAIGAAFVAFWGFHVFPFGRFRLLLHCEYLVAKIGVDTAEDEPL